MRSYRDGIRLFLLFMAKATGHPISKLPLSDLTANNVRAFLTYLEAERGNHIRSRNHRLAAVHLLESGVDVNVIRGWLGHVSLDTTNRYAEINIRMKQEALEACQIPSTSSAGPPRRPVWQSEPKLLEWLAAL